ncbi:hypothetical protein ACT6NV_14915 [Robiginitalea sp. IMCC44478]|uniref:hypothetical protein n=1 Tax=Robiginitalea sp. IMCC44478 TaxID=3459122 RepID=UPI004041F7B9
MTDYSSSIPETLEAFRKTLEEDSPSGAWPLALQCLWFDAAENWTAAHDIAQEMTGAVGSLLHAYLHRKEGDRWNAEYWYRQAGESYPQVALQAEFEQLLQRVLNSIQA